MASVKDITPKKDKKDKKAQKDGKVVKGNFKKALKKDGPGTKAEKAADDSRTLRLPRVELEEILKVAASVVQAKSTLAALTTVKLESLKDKCTVVGTDIETWWTKTISCSGDSVARCIPLAIFRAEVKALPSEIAEVELRFTEGRVSVNGRCEILTVEADEFPLTPEVAGTAAEVKDLCQKISQVVVASGVSDTRYTLNSVLLDFPAGRMVGTDGHRLHFVKMDKAAGVGKVLVPRKAATLASKLNASTMVSIGKKYVSFSVLGGQIIGQLVEGTFPAYEKIIPTASPIKVTFSAAEFLKVLEGAVPVSRDKAIRLTVNGKLVIEGQTADLGSYRHEIPCTSEGTGGKAFVVGFNAGYLIDAITAFGADETRMALDEAVKPCLVNDGAVVMPMRT